jgi:hypothetical protein
MKYVERLMFLVIPSCREAQKLQSRKLDEELSLWKRCSLWMHCAMCGWCRRYGKQTRFLNRLCSELPECGDFGKEEPIPDGVKARIAKSLSDTKGRDACQQ